MNLNKVSPTIAQANGAETGSVREVIFEFDHDDMKRSLDPASYCFPILWKKHALITYPDSKPTSITHATLVLQKNCHCNVQTTIILHNAGAHLFMIAYR